MKISRNNNKNTNNINCFMDTKKAILEALLKCQNLIDDNDSLVIDFEAGTIVSKNEVLLIEVQKYTGGQLTREFEISFLLENK